MSAFSSKVSIIQPCFFLHTCFSAVCRSWQPRYIPEDHVRPAGHNESNVMSSETRAFLSGSEHQSSLGLSWALCGSGWLIRLKMFLEEQRGSCITPLLHTGHTVLRREDSRMKKSYSFFGVWELEDGEEKRATGEDGSVFQREGTWLLGFYYSCNNRKPQH